MKDLHKTELPRQNPPALPVQEMQETRVQTPGREDPLEKEMAVHLKEMPTPVLPGKFRGQTSLAVYRPRITKSWLQLSN